MERENLKCGKLFTDMTEGLPEERLKGKELVYDYNHTRPSEEEKRIEIAKKLFGKIGNDSWIEPPINLAYGTHVFIGDNFYANFNLVIVDDNEVIIGNHVLFGPNVTISTTGHPIDRELRQSGKMYSFPVTIKDNVWLGSGVITNPGITIGENSIIGAGSVVTKDIPANVIAVGNPCKVLREINENDKIYYYKDHKVEDI
jgi:galactoside O-acetyltransferase